VVPDARSSDGAGVPPARALAGAGLSVLAVTNIFPNIRSPSSGTFVERQIAGLRAIGVDVEVMFVDREAEGRGTYRRVKGRVRTALSGRAHDMVHVMYGGVLADVTTRATGAPTVVSFCGSDLAGAKRSGLLREVTAGYGILASHRAAKRAAGVIVKSAGLRDALPDEVDRARVRVIPNGVDFERFRPLPVHECRRRVGWRDDDFHVVFHDRGDPDKRLDLARAACDELRRRGAPVCLHLMKSLAHDQVPQWLNAADVLLLTSLHEGSPNTVKEALACDRPVVSTDVGDVRERIEGIDGCWIADPDPVDLADKLAAVYQRPSPRTVAGRSSISGLSLEAVAHRIANFYADILND